VLAAAAGGGFANVVTSSSGLETLYKLDLAEPPPIIVRQGACKSASLDSGTPRTAALGRQRLYVGLTGSGENVRRTTPRRASVLRGAVHEAILAKA
jgi:hypothetical protein